MQSSLTQPAKCLTSSFSLCKWECLSIIKKRDFLKPYIHVTSIRLDYQVTSNILKLIITIFMFNLRFIFLFILIFMTPYRYLFFIHIRTMFNENKISESLVVFEQQPQVEFLTVPASNFFRLTVNDTLQKAKKAGYKRKLIVTRVNGKISQALKFHLRIAAESLHF